MSDTTFTKEGLIKQLGLVLAFVVGAAILLTIAIRSQSRKPAPGARAWQADYVVTGCRLTGPESKRRITCGFPAGTKAKVGSIYTITLFDGGGAPIGTLKIAAETTPAGLVLETAVNDDCNGFSVTPTKPAP